MRMFFQVQLFRELETIKVGHLQIEDDGVVRLLLLRGQPDSLQRFDAVIAGVDRYRPVVQHVFEDAQIGFVVIHDEHMSQRHLRFDRFEVVVFLRLQRQPKGEGAAQARTAGHGNFPAHQRGQAFADAQPQAGAAVAFAGAAVQLGKTLKDIVQFFRRDADAAVLDRELDRQCFHLPGHQLHVALFHFYDDFAFFREFDRIAQQIGQNLPDAHRISFEQVRDFDVDLADQFDIFLFTLGRENVDAFFHQITQGEHGIADGQFAHFDFGEIEDIVDDVQQGISRLFNVSHVIVLRSGQLCGQGQLGHADDAVEGGAYLMAHVGKEAAFRGGRGLGLFTRLLQFSFVYPAVTDAPHFIHVHLHLEYICFRIIDRFVGDSADRAHLIVCDDRGAHVADDVEMPFRISFCFCQVLIIVVNGRFFQPDGISPDAGVDQRVFALLGGAAAFTRLFRPDERFIDLLIGVHQVEISDLAAGQFHHFFQSMLKQFLLVLERHTTQHIEGTHTVRAQAQALLHVPFFRQLFA